LGGQQGTKEKVEHEFGPAARDLLLNQIDAVAVDALSSPQSAFLTNMLIRRDWQNEEERLLAVNNAFREDMPLGQLKFLVLNDLPKHDRMDMIWLIKNKPVVAGLMHLHLLDDNLEPKFKATLINRLVTFQFQHGPGQGGGGPALSGEGAEGGERSGAARFDRGGRRR